MVEDTKLKIYLVLQSFCPLFILLLIKHIGDAEYVSCFLLYLFHGNWKMLFKVITGPALGDTLISIFCILWFLLTLIVALGFRVLQKSNFDFNVEKRKMMYGIPIIWNNTIKVEQDSGVSFIVTFIVPLLVEDVSTMKGVVFFGILLFMIIFFLLRSNLFYQNPILVVLHYKTYEFQFVNPYSDVKENIKYIGLTKGSLPVHGVAIKRRYIAEDVFLICNE